MNRQILLGGIILLGFALRFYALNAVSLRGDEAFTVLHWMREPLGQTLDEIATKDPQAPLSYALYRGWALVMGTHEQVARLLPALLSVIGIPAMYALGYRLRGARLGLLAALLWAINPYQIWHAQDARSYAIWSVLSLLALWLALRALDKKRRIDWLLYVAAGALAGYVYYLELFFIVALNLYVLFTHWRNRPLLLRWLSAELAIGLLLAPWYLQPRLLTGSGYGGTGGGFDPAQWVTRFLPTLAFGDNARIFGEFYGVLAVLVGIGLGVGLVVWWQHNRRQALLLGVWGTIPLLLLGVVATRLSVFEPRYVLAAAPAYILILCVLALALRAKALKIAAISVLVLLSGFILYDYYFVRDYPKAPNWRELATYLSEEVGQNEWVTQAAADPAFMLYCGDYQIAEVCNDQLPANPTQSREEIEGNLATRSTENEAIWYVAAPQNWANATIAQDWLMGNMQRVRDASIGGLRVQQFRRWEVTPGDLSSAPMILFGQTAQLVGIETSVDAQAGQLIVLLYWQALEPTQTPLKIFVHLTNDTGIASQDDQYPQDGRFDTTSWEERTIFRDVYTLPLQGVEPGQYMLVVGFYDPETNRRLPIDGGNGDSYPVRMIEIP